MWFSFFRKHHWRTKRIPEIEEFYRVQSIYDIIAKVNADSKDQLNEIVVRKVREIEGIKNTLTMIIL